LNNLFDLEKMKRPYTISEIKNISLKPVFVLILSAFCLLSINFFSGYYKFEMYDGLFRFFHLNELYDSVYFRLNNSPDRQFWQLIYWASNTFLFYFLLPAIAIKFIFKEKLTDYGLKLQGALAYRNIYFIAFTFIFPVVAVASYSPHFQITYPFFVPVDKNKMFPYFFVWELFYILQFFSLEFFFRGFMVQGLKKELGIYSVFVMMVPYCMIHFGKPLPECIGSIFAGIFLGMMSYRTNSVWLGACLHVGVALTMDVLSLWHKGYI
jgi:uncharacterized protein